MTTTGNRKAALVFILVTVVLDVLSLGLIIPVAPRLVQELTTGSSMESLGDAPFYVAAFQTTWAVMQFLFSPVMGALSDRFGRRPVLLMSAYGLGSIHVLMALAPSLEWLFVGRILSGILSSSFSTANAYIADVTEPDKRTIAYGLFGAAFGFGFVVGPAVGGVLGDISVRLPFWVAAGLTFANAMYGTFVLPESLPVENRSPFNILKANPVGSLLLLTSTKALLPISVSYFLYQAAHQVFSSMFVLYTGFRFHWTPSQVGWTLTTVGIQYFIIQGGLVRPASRILGERTLTILGLSGGIIGFLGYAFASNGHWFYMSTFVFALTGFYTAAIQSVMSKKLDLQDQGKLSGANASLTGIAGMFCPFMYSQIFAATTNPASEAWYYPGSIFGVAALLISLALVLAIAFVPKHSNPVTT